MQGKYVGSCSGRKRKNPASQASPCLSWFCCASLPCRPAAICCYCCPAQCKHTNSIRRHPPVYAGGAYVVAGGVGAAYAPPACQDAALAQNL